VFCIPIGIHPVWFRMQTPESKYMARHTLGIPQSSVVVGSFQKDGNGWGEGMEPKLIKGPDVFLSVMGLLKNKIPELYVLLTGPARGYIKAGLTRMNIPFHHAYLSKAQDVGEYYQALDVYLVTSRQEGGPKAVLETMASGVPLVSTRVGQAMDLIKHGENGWMVGVEDVEGLAYCSEYIYQHRASLGENLRFARQTAEANSYLNQLPLWSKFMQGFIEG